MFRHKHLKLQYGKAQVMLIYENNTQINAVVHVAAIKKLQ